MTLSKIPNTETTVKLHYKDKIENPIENFIINSNFTNVKVVKYCNFVELLNEADVIIIDCPTTVIIESLASCKNVIYINLNIVKFTNEGETLLKESVLWIEKNKNWKNDLQKSINKFDQLSKNNTIKNSFMQHYANTNFTPENIWNLISKANKYVDESAPWQLIKTDGERAGDVLNILVIIIAKIAIFLSPIMPDTSENILNKIGLSIKNLSIESIVKDNLLNIDHKIKKPEIIFHKINE